MRLLALDTATDRMALALADGDAVCCVNAEGGAAASSQLLPEVLRLLGERQLRPVDIDAIAFGQGPGAFTGLRTAVSAAQGLAYGIGCPVLPIDSLMIVAEDARHQALWADDKPFEVWVAMDARMDEIYAAAYRLDGGAAGRWQVLHAPALYDLPSLLARWAAAPPTHVAGSAPAAFGERLPIGAAICWHHAQDRAAALLRLACAAWRSGAGLPPDQALPLYLRDKVALTTAERAAVREAKSVAPAAGL